MQWLELTDYKRLYIVLQAKSSKLNKGAQDIQSPEDVALEMATALDAEVDDECPLPRLPFLTHVFATEVPHMRYQRIVTLANEDHLCVAVGP